MLPLLSNRAMDDIFAWRPSGSVTVHDYLTHAHSLALVLPEGQGVLNLCEDRYHFAVVFAACVLTGKTSLQPASQSGETLARLAHEHVGAFCVTDGAFDVAGLRCFPLPELSSLPSVLVSNMPMVVAERVVAILFTSGSTGMPQPHTKTWGKLVQNGQAGAQALGLNENPMVIVGTVPAQHSYGFESTFLLAMHGGCSFWSGKPFYPQDVVDAIRAVPRPRMLVTTPYHLSAVVSSGLQWPALDLALSATAALSAELAAQVEQMSSAPVHEIYGSTESSQLAYRRTTAGPLWHLLPGVELAQIGDTTYAFAGHVEGRVPLSDIIELQGGVQGSTNFLLHGRHADLVNIAGKRSSLAYLDHQLRAIDGVQDGAFFLPDAADAAHSSDSLTRLVAFVVAPGLERNALLRLLRQRIDSLFLPRPLVFLDALPRNSTGKLPRTALQALYLERVNRSGD